MYLFVKLKQHPLQKIPRCQTLNKHLKGTKARSAHSRQHN